MRTAIHFALGVLHVSTATGAIDRARNRQQRLRTIDEAAKKMFARLPPKR